MNDAIDEPEAIASDTVSKRGTVSNVPRRRRLTTAAMVRGIVALLLLGITASLFVEYRHVLTLTELARHEASFRTVEQSHPIVVTVLAFLVYVLVTGLSLPGAAVLSLVYAWFFGFFKGVVLVSIASTCGATLAFLLSRYLFRDAIQSRFGDRLRTVNQRLADDGAYYLFSLRLVPLVPFFVINLVMGLTSMRVRTFWCISQVGMLPGTVAYMYAGSSLPSWADLADRGTAGVLSPRLVAAFTLLGLFPIIAKKLTDRW